MPQITAATGTGTYSSESRSEGAGADGMAVPGGAGLIVLTAALWGFGAGAAINGCVFAIFTAGPGAAAGSGRMLMRAVSFFGPASPPPEPG